MNTVFKVGMKVYDEVNFPGVEGTVHSLCDDSIHPVCVRFVDVFSCYTCDGRWSEYMQVPLLSTTPYTIERIGFSQEPQFDEDRYKGKYVRCWDSQRPSLVDVGKCVGFEYGQYLVTSPAHNYDEELTTPWGNAELLTDECVQMLKSINLL